MRAAPILALICLVLAATAVGQETPPPESAPAQQPPTPEPALPTDIRQVQIQVWISETGEQGLRDLGANLVYNRVVRGRETTGSVRQVTTRVTDLRDPLFTVTLPDPQATRPFFDLPRDEFGAPAVLPEPVAPDVMRPDQDAGLPGTQAQEGAGLTFTIMDSDHGTLDAAFRATEDKTDLDLISKPELLVVNNSYATIHAGAQVPYQAIRYDNQGRPQTLVEWKDVGAKLTLRPVIRPDNTIWFEIRELEVSDVQLIPVRGLDLPVFSKRSQIGEVIVPNGQTLVIGGLSTRVIRKTERRVPIVGAIPILGIPFRGRRSEATTNHLLIFVSPTIVDLYKLDQAAVDALQFWQRERWKHQEEIDEEIRLFEDEL